MAAYLTYTYVQPWEVSSFYRQLETTPQKLILIFAASKFPSTTTPTNQRCERFSFAFPPLFSGLRISVMKVYECKPSFGLLFMDLWSTVAHVLRVAKVWFRGTRVGRKALSALKFAFRIIDKTKGYLDYVKIVVRGFFIWVWVGDESFKIWVLLSQQWRSVGGYQGVMSPSGRF